MMNGNNSNDNIVDDEKKSDLDDGNDDVDDDVNDSTALGSSNNEDVEQCELQDGVAEEDTTDAASDAATSAATVTATATATTPATGLKTMELNVAYEALETMRIVNLQLEFSNEHVDTNRCVECMRIEKAAPVAAAAADDNVSSTSMSMSSLRLPRPSASSSWFHRSSTTPQSPTSSSSSLSFSQRWRNSTSSSRTGSSRNGSSGSFLGSFQRPSSLSAAVTETVEESGETNAAATPLTSTSSSSTTTDNTNTHTVSGGDPPCLACGTPVCMKVHSSPEFRNNVHSSISICSQPCSLLFSPTLTAQALMMSSSSQQQPKQQMEQSSRSSSTTTPTTIPTTTISINEVLEVYDRALLVLQYSKQFIPDICTALESMERRHDQFNVGSSATGVLSGVVGVAAAATIWTPVGPPLLVASILFGTGGAVVAAGSEAVNYRSDPTVLASRILIWYTLIESIVQVPAAIDSMSGDDNINNANNNSNNNSSRLHWTRMAMNVAKPLTVGAMSAISVFTESRELRSNIQKINEGSVCDKAQQLRTIHSQLLMADNDEDNAGNNGGSGSFIPTSIMSKQLHMSIQRRQQQDIEEEQERLEMERQQWKSTIL